MQRASAKSLFRAVLFVALMCGARTYAGSLGSVAGAIATDGTPATVTITCGGVTKTMRTTPGGGFSFTGLPEGACTLQVSASGFSSTTKAITLKGAMSIKVALTATAPVAKTDTREDKPAEKRKMPEASPAKAEPKMAKESRMPAPPPAVMPSPSAPSPSMYRPATGASNGYAIQQNARQPIDPDRPKNTESYDKIDDNPFHTVAANPLSTFSVDVDTASYANVRRFLEQGTLPPKDSVRIEEMINYFTYDYGAPNKGEPFSITSNVTQSPWNANMKLVRVGIKTQPIEASQVPARNLVFLIDTSGSMSDANKLPLLQQSFSLLVNDLRKEDSVAIVTYAGSAGLALPATSGANKETIRKAIFALQSSGSTNGAEGIQLAYDIAEKNVKKGSINRVILATDGDFNVGTTDEGSLIRLIEKERERHISLTTLGFGMGNYKDSTMEKLADKGNGNSAYIDTLAEARKVLVKEAGATLVTVAKDVKLQIEFNPTTVAGYRLVGYEDRLLADQDFNDDKKDAGDVGAGASVTALYEIVPVGQAVPGVAKVDSLKYQTTGGPSNAALASELMTVKIRYKAPEGNKSTLMSRTVANVAVALDQAPVDVRWATAIAAFGMMLRESPNRGNMTWAQIEALAKGAVGTDAEGYRAQALQLIQHASRLPKS
ncbi:MAG TPA: von Willebrand factor type A domain-containing protein [Kofleriaceae bacterium]|jgi:Ca-activated chloride channel family protein